MDNLDILDVIEKYKDVPEDHIYTPEEKQQIMSILNPKLDEGQRMKKIPHINRSPKFINTMVTSKEATLRALRDKPPLLDENGQTEMKIEQTAMDIAAEGAIEEQIEKQKT